MLLSLVIPVFNTEEYLPQCLKCLEQQQTGEMELILVDDGSTDQSGIICDRFAKNNPHVQVIHQKNQGIAVARNVGVQKAKGEYVAFVDSDDWISEQWFQKIQQVIHCEFPDIIVFDYYLSSHDNTFHPVIYGRKEGQLEPHQLLADTAKDVLIKGVVWNKVAKRSLWLDTPFDSSLRWLEDYEMLCRLLQKADSVYYLKQPLYYYRQREESLIHGHSFEQTWKSYQIAVKREQELGKVYAKETAVACSIQAYCVCQKYHLEKKRQYRTRMKEAQQYIRDHIIVLLFDQDLGLKWKMKFFMAYIGIVLNRRK